MVNMKWISIIAIVIAALLLVYFVFQFELYSCRPGARVYPSGATVKVDKTLILAKSEWAATDIYHNRGQSGYCTVTYDFLR